MDPLPRRLACVRSAFGARSAAENRPLSDRVLSFFKGLRRSFGKKNSCAETLGPRLATRARKMPAYLRVKSLVRRFSDIQNYNHVAGGCKENAWPRSGLTPAASRPATAQPTALLTIPVAAPLRDKKPLPKSQNTLNLSILGGRRVIELARAGSVRRAPRETEKRRSSVRPTRVEIGIVSARDRTLRRGQGYGGFESGRDGDDEQDPLLAA